MAFHLNASYTEELRIEGRSQKEVFVLLLEAIKAMKWTTGKITATEIIAFAGISLVSFGERITFQLDGDRVTMNSSCLMPQIYALGKNRRNIHRLTSQLNLLWEVFSPQALADKYLSASVVLIAADRPLTSNAAQIFDVGDTKSNISSFLSIFNPKPGYYITPILIDLNIFYFLCMTMGGCGFLVSNIQAVISFGANFSLLTLDGQWWRIFSCQFMHAGLMHLLLNVYALLFIGIFLEPILGSLRFAIYYLITGTAASLASLWMHPDLVSLGASGAIFGLFGIFLALLSSGMLEKTIRKALLISMSLYVAIILLNGLKGNTDNAAHMGGLIAGYIIGWVTIPELRVNQTLRMLKTVSIMMLSALILTVTAFKLLPNNLKKYETGMIQFAQYEAMAMRCYHMPTNTTMEDMMFEIKNQSMGFWHQSDKLVHQLDKLRLNPKLHKRNQLLEQYCAYRLKNCGFELKRLEAEQLQAKSKEAFQSQPQSLESDYSDSIDIYNEKIQEVVYNIQL
ncbi:MAG TPA: rhomboid family intramembrane serine protease [Arachidicoccus sp.]|nr:rhomboid family intramembrane serine protease [Arachidicoccus sp.]